VETSQRRTHRGAVRLLEGDVVAIATRPAANLRATWKAVTPATSAGSLPSPRRASALPVWCVPHRPQRWAACQAPVSLPPARRVAGATPERNLKEVPDCMSDPSRRWLPSRLRGHVGQRRGLAMEPDTGRGTVMNRLRGRLVVEADYARADSSRTLGRFGADAPLS